MKKVLYVFRKEYLEHHFLHLGGAQNIPFDRKKKEIAGDHPATEMA